VLLISDGSNYKVMKGDLLVVQSKRINSIQSIWGISKDTWIISDSLQELQKPQEQQQHSIEVKRTNQVSISTALTSRNAENLFWVEIVRKNNGVN
jgi:hypothetical protein